MRKTRGGFAHPTQQLIEQRDNFFSRSAWPFYRPRHDSAESVLGVFIGRPIGRYLILPKHVVLRH
jgi:hypothetical protein